MGVFNALKHGVLALNNEKVTLLMSCSPHTNGMCLYCIGSTYWLGPGVLSFPILFRHAGYSFFSVCLSLDVSPGLQLRERESCIGICFAARETTRFRFLSAYSLTDF